MIADKPKRQDEIDTAISKFIGEVESFTYVCSERISEKCSDADLKTVVEAVVDSHFCEGLVLTRRKNDHNLPDGKSSI